jgi:hypothetical protein
MFYIHCLVSRYLYNPCGPSSVARCIPKLAALKGEFRELLFCGIRSLYDSYLSDVNAMLDLTKCEDLNGEWEFSWTD